MTTENGGFDAGAFYDEGVEEAGVETEEVVTDSPGKDDSANVVSQVDKSESEAAVETSKPEQAAETKPAETKPAPSAEEVAAALKSTEEAEQEVESVISALLPEPQAPEAAQQKPDFEPGKYVPVEDHIKLRQRAQAAEREADELKQRLETSNTQTGGAKPGEEVEKSPLEKFVDENPDEDLVPARVQLEEREFQEAKQQKAQSARERAEQAEREKQEKQYRTSQAVKALSTRAEQSEVEFRKAHDDYEKVTKPIVDGGFLNDADRLNFLKDENPAKRLYEICKAKAEAIRSALGKPVTAPKKEATKAASTPEEEAAAEETEPTDDQIFNEFFGEEK